MAPEVDILTTFNGDWITTLEAEKKWLIKKDELVKLIEAASVPKLKEGDYSGVVACLLKLSKDSQVVVA